MSNHHLRNTALSLKAKGLMSLMLSLPVEWNYTTRGLAKICKDGVDSISATINELERHGYLTRRRLRDDHGRLGETEYTVHEQPIEPKKPDIEANSPKRDFPVQVNPILEKPIQEKPILEKPAQEKHAQSNTNKTSINKLNTDVLNIQSINPECLAEQQADLATKPKKTSREAIDEIDRIDVVYRKLIMENVEYKFLIQRYGTERMNEFVELMLETVLSKRDYIRIGSEEFPREVVKSRMLKIDSSHIEYIIDCIDKNTTKVRNIKAYLLTALYNAPATIDNYYRAEVNFDMYGGGNDRFG